MWMKAKVKNLNGSIEPNKYHKKKYDAVIAYHALQRTINANVVQLIKSWKRCLKPEGELYIFVPSLEWAAREILAEDPSSLLLVHIFGDQGDENHYHLSGHTLRRLRVDLTRAGMKVTSAKTGYYISGLGGKEYRAEQHVVTARL